MGHEARLHRKSLGSEAKLSFMGHLLVKNGKGPIPGGCVTTANGRAERTATLDIFEKRADRLGLVTLGPTRAMKPAIT